MTITADTLDRIETYLITLILALAVGFVVAVAVWLWMRRRGLIVHDQSAQTAESPPDAEDP